MVFAPQYEENNHARNITARQSLHSYYIPIYQHWSPVNHQQIQLLIVYHGCGTVGWRLAILAILRHTHSPGPRSSSTTSQASGLDADGASIISVEANVTRAKLSRRRRKVPPRSEEPLVEEFATPVEATRSVSELRRIRINKTLPILAATDTKQDRLSRRRRKAESRVDEPLVEVPVWLVEAHVARSQLEETFDANPYLAVNAEVSGFINEPRDNGKHSRDFDLSGDRVAPDTNLFGDRALQAENRLETDTLVALTNQLFDQRSYLSLYHDLRSATGKNPHFDPKEHFLKHGSREGRVPSAFFDLAYTTQRLAKFDETQILAAEAFCYFVTLPFGRRFVPN